MTMNKRINSYFGKIVSIDHEAKWTFFITAIQTATGNLSHLYMPPLFQQQHNSSHCDRYAARKPSIQFDRSSLLTTVTDGDGSDNGNSGGNKICKPTSSSSTSASTTTTTTTGSAATHVVPTIIVDDVSRKIPSTVQK
ncbi:serine/threonine-protein kinase PknD [Trichinella spiralis]|uniref:serine/threonine-protein kinase PknD n=1 Tax=Trichinella spiralis TaxID=6334 RepID=UPI0001EFC6FC|nr:serine/threonine-protein kinase PknD [Trichinella spiralis]